MPTRQLNDLQETFVVRRSPDQILGVSPGTLDNHIPDLRELRAGSIPAQVEGGTR
ncbi:hypothetical protein [Kitasatospora sp. NPDC097691]|uniref:hypothetical protein n=1 Tax=Kitasatospora sp. NPDC097691 TaxID=3157231 RepID=UPI0033173055